MAEILTTYESYDEYYGTNGQYVPTSTITLAEDIIFEDGTSLVEKLESLKVRGIDVKNWLASAISMIGYFTATGANWDTILDNLKRSMELIPHIELFKYCEDNLVYTIPTDGTYQIDCATAIMPDGTFGNYFSGQVYLTEGEILTIYVGTGSAPSTEISITENNLELISLYYDDGNVTSLYEFENVKSYDNVNAIEGYVKIFNIDSV